MLFRSLAKVIPLTNITTVDGAEDVLVQGVYLDHIEVLKGPQGTLYGQNATGGAIIIDTQKPKFDFGGEFTASYGNHQEIQARSIVTGPLTDKIAVLFSGALLQFLGLTWMSTTAVLNQLPETFRGGTTVFATLRVVIVFGALTAASIITSLWVFRRKDL